jgi:hypothetical protein
VEYRQEQQARHSATLAAGLGSELTSIGFARLARALIGVGHDVGLQQLRFRSPGRVGVGRAIRRNADGSATIAVRYRNRPALSVAADMIEGVVQAGGKSVITSGVRDALWAAAGAVLSDEYERARSDEGPPRSPGGVGETRSQSSAARGRAADPGSGPPDQATRRAA